MDFNMLTPKLFYRTPNMRVVEINISKTLLAISVGTSLPSVEEEEIDNEF